MIHKSSCNQSANQSRNAIQVKNIAQSQIGHIPREVAGRMAPLMDRGLITVEGVMHEGNCKYCVCIRTVVALNTVNHSVWV